MPHYATDERHELAQTLRATRPGAATLCGDWDATHLAAHLVLRERSIVELGGRLPVESLQRRAAQALDRLVADRSYGQLADAVDRGPTWREVIGPVPTAWFWSLPPVRERVNLLEYLVHHEDVRRAGVGWQPRAVPIERQQAIWTQLKLITKMTLRKVPVRLVLAWPSHGELACGSRKVSSSVTVTGDPVELALLAFGRSRVAQLNYDGTTADVTTVREAEIAI